MNKLKKILIGIGTMMFFVPTMAYAVQTNKQIDATSHLKEVVAQKTEANITKPIV